MSQPFKIVQSILSLLILHSQYCAGQNFHFSDIHENMYQYNPALITQTKKIDILAIYRNQWPGNSDFITYNSAFFFTSGRLKSTGGIELLRDTQGENIISSNQFSLLYGYKTKLTRNWFFSGGIQAMYQLYTKNFSDQTFINGQTPNISLTEKLSGFDFSAGVMVSYGEIAGYGISLSNMGALIPSQSVYHNLQMNISYQGKYVLTQNHSFREYYLEPIVMYSLQNKLSELFYGARIEYFPFFGGAYLRQNLRFQYDAIIILLGTRFGKIALFYTYDINLSGVDSRFTNLAAHEVTFLYNLEYKSKTMKRGAIKCPKF
jgi:type IX secretion system PorP/SprF family membrane protein